jgi:RHS repeat-associated protein
MSHKLSLLAVILLGIISLVGKAQNPSRDQEKGFVPGVPYASSDIESVNLTNGNLAFSVPLGSLPKGRGEATSGLFLKYNSKLWKKHIEEIMLENGNTSRQSFLGRNSDGGWKYGEKYALKVTNRNDGLDEIVPMCRRVPDGQGTLLRQNLEGSYIWKVQIEFPDGSLREFRPTGYWLPPEVSGMFYNIRPTGQINTYTSSSGCSPVTIQSPDPYISYYSADGSYMRLITYPNGDWQLYTADGEKITNNSTEGQRIYDRNGNYVQYGSVTLPDNSQATGWIDQLGRYTAKKATSSSEDTVYQIGTDGQLLEWKVRWKPVTVMKKYRTDCATCTRERGQTSYQVARALFRVVDNVQTPNGLVYTFDYFAHNGNIPYDPSGGTTNQNWSPGWGEVKSVTMPSQAKTSYDFEIYEDPEVTNTGYIKPDEILDWSGRTTQKTLTYIEEYDSILTPREDKWIYRTSKMGSSVTNPDGSITSQSFYHLDNDPNLGGYVYKETSSDNAIVEKLWQFNEPTGFNAGRRANPYIKTQFQTIADGSGNPSLTAIKDYNYDKNGNIIKVAEYEWVEYSSIPRNEYGIVTGIPAGLTPKRITKTNYYNSTPDASYTSTTENVLNGYWNSSAITSKKSVASVEVQNSSGQIVSRSEFTYDNPDTTSNLTQTKIWDSHKNGVNQPYSNPLTASNSISTTAQYDQYGNPTQTTDAKGTISTITYGAVNGYTGLYPTQTVSAYGTAIQRTSTAVYDFYTGLATSVTDVDNNVTSATEYDALGRPLKSKAAVGTPLEIWTRMEYDDVARRVITRSDVETKGDGKKIAVQHYDQLGRVRLSRSIENAATEDPYNEQHGIKVQTRYQAGNPYSYQLSSNPYRAATSATATAEESMGWTRSKSINTGKHSEVETFTGASLPAPWGTNAASTGVVTTDVDADRALVTDQAGKRRISKTNALGQLINVWEVKESDADTEAISFGTLSLNGLKTSYQYDTLNNLTTVSQGVQTRTFAYDSLARLKQANNPESGAISYVYDNNGNLTQKTDARQVVTNYVYDNLNRVTSRNYSAPAGLPNYQATPNVVYTYDDVSVANSKGRLTKVTNGFSATEYTQFDILGRVLKSRQTTDGVVYNPMEYVYNLSGAMVEQLYPSGRVVKNTLDADGDLSQVQSQKANGTLQNYANSFNYTAAGAVSSMRLGNGRWENTQFNSRLQPTQIGLGAGAASQNLLKLNFDYGITDNNGNVRSQQIIVPTVGATAGFTAIQTYTYDSLNRIKDAKELIGTTQQWKQTFQYDRYGNRRFDTANNNTTTLQANCQTAVCNPTIDPATNKLVGYGFDSSGNTKTDANGQTFTYDSENKQVEVKTSASQTIGQYFYDGDGKRVKKYVPSTGETTIFVYDASGKMVAEYSTIVASTTNAKVSYLTNDHLGSPRITTDANGQVISRRDFQPFGEEIQRANYGTDNVRQKFTSYERDTESELDFAQARYYSKNLGRFYSVDPENAGAKEDDPQSWNGYAYSRNNPILYTDPDGLEYKVCNQEGQCWTHSDGDFKKAQKGFPNLYEEVDKDGHYDSGNILDSDGNVIGTYERTSIDRDYQFVYSVSEESQKKGKVVIGAAAFGITVGVGAGVAAGTIGIVGLRLLAQRVAISVLTSGQIAKTIGKEQTKLLGSLFGTGKQGAVKALANPKVSQALNSESLIIYREIAKRAIAAGNDKSGTQKLRIELIEKVLLQRGVILPK